MWDTDVVHENGTCRRHPKSNFVLDGRSTQSFHSLGNFQFKGQTAGRGNLHLFEDESPNALVPLTSSPNDKDITASRCQCLREPRISPDLRDRSIGDPCLASVKHKPAIDLLGCGLHACRIRAVVGFRQTLRIASRKRTENLDIEDQRTNAPTSSPDASRGRYFSFCASVPNSFMGCITREDCTEAVERYPESTLALDRFRNETRSNDGGLEKLTSRSPEQSSHTRRCSHLRNRILGW